MAFDFMGVFEQRIKSIFSFLGKLPIPILNRISVALNVVEERPQRRRRKEYHFFMISQAFSLDRTISYIYDTSCSRLLHESAKHKSQSIHGSCSCRGKFDQCDGS